MFEYDENTCILNTLLFSSFFFKVTTILRNIDLGVIENNGDRKKNAIHRLKRI